jgi:hypothetical protein
MTGGCVRRRATKKKKKKTGFFAREGRRGKVLYTSKLQTLAAHVTHTFPSTLQVFLPERHLAVSAADGENVPGEAPRDAPHDVWELSRRSTDTWGCAHRRVERGPDPRRSRRVFCPHEYSLVLPTTIMSRQHIYPSQQQEEGVKSRTCDAVAM